VVAILASLFEQSQRSAGVLYGDCGGVWVMLMYAPPVLADMLVARPSLRSMFERHPAGFPTLTWVLPSAGYSMDGETRKAAATITGEYEAAILGQATLIEGSGFQAATVRAIVSGIDMMARAKAPKKVFGELRPCVGWCIPLLPESGGAAVTEPRITAALESVRKSLG
jgi:hypothetical protein